MTNESSDENATPPPEPPKDGELSDQQVESVSGGTGRTIQDCEGFTVMQSQLLTKSPALKSE